MLEDPRTPYFNLQWDCRFPQRAASCRGKNRTAWFALLRERL
jgi:hypothetical protein